MSGRVAGKVAIVTGGARGQGAAEASLLAAEGARVVVADVLDAEGEAVVAELGAAARYVHLDVSDPDVWEAAVALTLDAFGPPTVLVNNAAILGPQGPLVETSLADYERVVAVNQVGCFLGMRAVVPTMAGAGGGSIVNVSSTGGLVGVKHVIGYVASKWAVRGMTKAAAVELGPQGIRVNSVHPGPIDTPMLGAGRAIPADGWAHLPLGRIAQPEEVATLVLFLASDESSYCTGSEFIVDGGRTAM